MLIFFFIVKIIFLSIIKGLIVEEFTHLREHKNEIEMNIKNKCFICDLDKSTLDTLRGGFSQHILVDHNWWNYICYLIYLYSKDKNDYTGIESYIS
jgi:hypothetical protein